MKLTEPIITKGRFDEASAMYPPNAYTRFIYDHFSKGTTREGLLLGNLALYILGGLFAVGFIGTVANAPRALIGTVTYAYAVILTIVVLCIFIAYIMNNNRLKNIIEELGITAEEYNELVELYYPKKYK